MGNNFLLLLVGVLSVDWIVCIGIDW